MKICPKCNAKGISLKGLANSDPATPVRCTGCGGLFYIPNVLRNILEVLPNFALPLVLIGSLVLASWLPIIAFLIAVPLGFLSAAYFCTPVYTNKEEVKVSRKYDLILRYIVLSVLVGLVLWFIF